MQAIGRLGSASPRSFSRTSLVISLSLPGVYVVIVFSMDLVEFLLALSKQLLTLFWAGSHITLAKRRCRLLYILDFHRPLRPFS
ncbi:hypothetical protein ALP96_03961 [Pseudomonas savastanoi pv. glycinea]|nr:hypothetical protein ALP96_03961 [Pseudomonas savastanoi pv. glycinea]